MMRFVLCLGWLWLALSALWAQNRHISTAAPTLQFSLDPRSGGFGEISTVSPKGYYAIGLDGNPALLAQGVASYGGQVGASVPRWINPILQNPSFWQAGSWASLSERSTLAFSAQYFNFGEIPLTNPIGDPVGIARPHDWNASLRYALQVSDQVSLGLGMKLFYSTLDFDPQVPEKFLSGAADVGIWYHDQQQRKGYTLRWQVGAALSDLGPKVRYDFSWPRDFIPTRLELGGLGGITWENYALDFAYQARKLMVPSVQYDQMGQYIGGGGSSDLGLIEGMFTSFGDSDLGLRGEFQEIIHQFGLEQRLLPFQDEGWLLALREGLILEHSNYGNRRFLTTGLSVGYQFIRFDLNGTWHARFLYRQNAFPSQPRGLWHWNLGVTFVFQDLS